MHQCPICGKSSGSLGQLNDLRGENIAVCCASCQENGASMVESFGRKHSMYVEYSADGSSSILSSPINVPVIKNYAELIQVSARGMMDQAKVNINTEKLAEDMEAVGLLCQLYRATCFKDHDRMDNDLLRTRAELISKAGNARPYKFKIGDPVTFVNDYGIKFPECVIVGMDSDERSSGKPHYYFEPHDAHWFSVSEENLIHAKDDPVLKEVGGHKIRTMDVNSGTWYLVGATREAFPNMDEAEEYAMNNPAFLLDAEINVPSAQAMQSCAP